MIIEMMLYVSPHSTSAMPELLLNANLPSQLNPQLLKPAVTKALNELLQPIQEAYQKNKEWQEVALKAYPEPAAPKKEKKVKNKGTRHPGPAPAGPDQTTQEIQELPIRSKEDGKHPAS